MTTSATAASTSQWHMPAKLETASDIVNAFERGVTRFLASGRVTRNKGNSNAEITRTYVGSLHSPSAGHMLQQQGDNNK
eukprot:8899168-Pyramimonas_sp.AAC.1